MVKGIFRISGRKNATRGGGILLSVTDILVKQYQKDLGVKYLRNGRNRKGSVWSLWVKVKVITVLSFV